MRFLSTRIHGLADYLTGIILILLPFIFGFADGGSAQWIPIVLGVALLASSMMTRYEYGLFPVIPMPVHLTFDMLAGIFLALSPWIFGFADQVFLPHLLFGIFEITASLITQKVPSNESAATHKP